MIWIISSNKIGVLLSAQSKVSCTNELSRPKRLSLYRRRPSPPGRSIERSNSRAGHPFGRIEIQQRGRRICLMRSEARSFRRAGEVIGPVILAWMESAFAIAKPRDYDPRALKTVRPSIEELKQRYSRELMRKKMLERHRAERPELADAPRTPDNSVSWLGRPPRTVAECMWISDQITEEIEQWKSDYPQIFSSAS